MDLQKSIEKIEIWLKENAPRILEHSFQPPAHETAFGALEQLTGKTLPEDFKKLYLWHNGMDDDENMGSLFYGMQLLSLQEVIKEIARRKQFVNEEKIVLEKADEGIDKSDLLNPNWIPFCFDNAQTWLLLDTTPTDKGSERVIFVDDEYLTAILVADSISAFATDFVSDLENGLYHLDEDALEDGDQFLETAEEIDLVNWRFSEKWKR